MPAWWYVIASASVIVIAAWVIAPWRDHDETDEF